MEFERPSGRVVAETEDISTRGLFIRTDSMLPVGETSKILVELPDGTEVEIRARVAHMLTPAAARTLGRHPGMGFELVGPSTPDRNKLLQHVSELKTEITNPNLSTTTQVIVIEPSPGLRSRMTRCLETAGFRVSAVATFSQGLEACGVWRPDAIVAASQLDSMTGIDLAYAMSEHATLSDVPLVLNGDDSDLQRLEAYRAGVRDYIPRPFLDEELVIRVHRIAAPLPASMNQGLRGSLVDISLATLLSLFEFERKSGVLLLLREGEIARVFVAEGRLLKVEATEGNGVPRDRIMKLLDWRDGQFEFTPAQIGGKDEVGSTVTQLLLEHARRNDEGGSRNSEDVIPPPKP